MNFPNVPWHVVHREEGDYVYCGEDRICYPLGPVGNAQLIVTSVNGYTKLAAACRGLRRHYRKFGVPEDMQEIVDEIMAALS